MAGSAILANTELFATESIYYCTVIKLVIYNPRLRLQEFMEIQSFKALVCLSSEELKYFRSSRPRPDVYVQMMCDMTCAESQQEGKQTNSPNYSI